MIIYQQKVTSTFFANCTSQTRYVITSFLSAADSMFSSQHIHAMQTLILEIRRCLCNKLALELIWNS